MKIAIDPGHGNGETGCIGNGHYEKDLNLEYAKQLKDKLLKYKEVQVIMTRLDDTNPSLSNRAKLANDEGCDLFISCHLNAFNREARGTEIVHSIYADDNFKAFCNNMAVKLAMDLQIPFRRIFSKKGNNGDYFGVIRETKMPAMIVEALFLDNKEDAMHYNPVIIADSIAKSIANYYNLQSDSKPNTLYRVVAGSYHFKDNAVERMEELKKKGINSFLWEVKD